MNTLDISNLTRDEHHAGMYNKLYDNNNNSYVISGYMGKLNKVITTFQQDFTDAEKAMARRNISAMSLSQRLYISGNKAITARATSTQFVSSRMYNKGIFNVNQ